MWLKDMLPNDIPNIRIMIYGYDNGLAGHNKADNTLLVYQRLFIQDIENARVSVKVGIVSIGDVVLHILMMSYKKTRPIIFIGHSLGGILILQVRVSYILNLSKIQTESSSGIN